MKTIKIMSLLFASLLLGACGGDDDGGTALFTTTEMATAPKWQISWTNNQTRPAWKEPDATAYENWTFLMVQIEETLRPYVSDGDLMVIFVNNELRGLAKPAVSMTGALTNPPTFVMKAYGNETGSERVNIKLSYYCQKLRHIFTLTDNITFNSEVTTGLDEDFIPPFTEGSEKYTVRKTVYAETLLNQVGIYPNTGDLVGAFVGEECRGVATISGSGSTSMLVLARSAGEPIDLRYYDAEGKRLYTIPNAVN